jgi:hypothetical protein
MYILSLYNGLPYDEYRNFNLSVFDSHDLAYIAKIIIEREIKVGIENHPKGNCANRPDYIGYISIDEKNYYIDFEHAHCDIIEMPFNKSFVINTDWSL